MTNFVCIPYLNQTSRFDPYSYGDKLKVSALGPTDVEAKEATEAADKIFRMLNLGGRPNGVAERSLSVGDVVVIEWFDPSLLRLVTERLACEPHGWRRI